VIAWLRRYKWFRRLDGLYRRTMIFIFGKPTYWYAFEFIRKDHRLPLDFRAMNRAALKARIVFFAFITPLLFVVQFQSLQAIAAADPSDYHFAWFMALPYCSLPWIFLFLFKSSLMDALHGTFSLPSSAYIVASGLAREQIFDIVLSTVVVGTLALIVYFTNRRDTWDLTTEHGSARLAYPHEILPMYPPGYDIWEGTTPEQEDLLKMRSAEYRAYRAMLDRYADEYRAYEETLHREGLIAYEDDEPGTYRHQAPIGSPLYDRIARDLRVRFESSLSPEEIAAAVTPLDQPQQTVAPENFVLTDDDLDRMNRAVERAHAEQVSAT